MERSAGDLPGATNQTCSYKYAAWDIPNTPELSTCCNACVNLGKGLVRSRNTRRQCKMSFLVSRLSLSLHIKSIAKASTLIKLGVFALFNHNLRCSLFSRMNYVGMWRV